MDITLPFLKWVGGKRWLLSIIKSLLPPKWNIYYEPFLGGGAIFFGILPDKALLSDKNPELINAYLQVRDDVDLLISKLNRKKISSEYFYKMRSKLFEDKIDQAVRFIYLNKTAFNGIYRVNLQGEFNVPFGCKPNTRLCESELLQKASLSLKPATLSCADFEESLERVKAEDLVYLDPPYTVKHNNNGFRRYNEAIFTWADQLRLAKAVQRIINRGAFVVLSNAYHLEILELYPNLHAISVSRASNLSADPKNRGPITEALLISDNLLSTQHLKLSHPYS